MKANIYISGRCGYGTVAVDEEEIRFFSSGDIETAPLGATEELLASSDCRSMIGRPSSSMAKCARDIAPKLRLLCEMVDAQAMALAALDPRLDPNDRVRLAKKLNHHLRTKDIAVVVESLLATSPLGDYAVDTLVECPRLKSLVGRTELAQPSVVSAEIALQSTSDFYELLDPQRRQVQAVLVDFGILAHLIHGSEDAAETKFVESSADIERLGLCILSQSNFGNFFHQFLSRFQAIKLSQERLADVQGLKKIAEDPDWRTSDKIIRAGADPRAMEFVKNAYAKDGAIFVAPEAPVVVAHGALNLTRDAFCECCIWNREQIKSVFYSVYAPLEFREEDSKSIWSRHVFELAKMGIPIAYMVGEKKARSDQYRDWRDNVLGVGSVAPDGELKANIVDMTDKTDLEKVSENVECFAPNDQWTENYGFIFLKKHSTPIAFKSIVDAKDDTRSLLALPRLQSKDAWSNVRHSLIEGLEDEGDEDDIKRRVQFLIHGGWLSPREASKTLKRIEGDGVVAVDKKAKKS